MNDDRRYEAPCRIGLLAAAAVHWTAAAVFILDSMNADVTVGSFALMWLMRSGLQWLTL